MRIVKLVVVIMLAVTLMAVIAALWPSTVATADSAGGIIRWKSQTVLSGTQSYMATDPVSTFETSAVYVGDYGALQYQIAVDVPDDEILGPRIITWTPQFSIQPVGNCDAATAWFDGTVYQAYGDGAYYAPVVYAWEQSPMSARTSGSEIIGFEAATVGACARLKFVIESTGDTFTPTVYLRMLNRQ